MTATVSAAVNATVSATVIAPELSPIDVAFARFVARGAPEPHAMLLHHSALLVSAERSQGNSCVDLAAHTGQSSPDPASAFVYPGIDDWCTQLLASGRCVTANQLLVDAHTLTPLVLDGTRLYLHRHFAAERRLAAAVRARLTVAPAHELDESVTLFRTLFPGAATAVDWQAVAAVAALRSPLVFVTGGPGTGKTTVAARLLALLLQRDHTLDIAVAAPTGRAAARLTEAIGAAVRREGLKTPEGAKLPSVGNTLHRLLGYMPWSEQFRFHAGNPLPHDVVIVDEASMVDVLMMDALFAALRPAARLIVLGDPDQLASVDTGFVLGDVARAARVAGGACPDTHSDALGNDYARLSGGRADWLETQPHTGALRDAVVRLRVSHRFGARSGIGALARATQEGDADAALAVLLDDAHPDVALDGMSAARGTATGTSTGAHAAQLLGPLVPFIEQYLAMEQADDALAALARFRLLCALREGDMGVVGLNALVEQWLTAQGRDATGGYNHRPVLITANDVGMQLFNGDVGMTLAVDGVPMVHFRLPDGGVRSLPPARLPAHETAWAMTVHKSQGSEFDHVRFVLPATDNRLLTRELVYTGVTRAKASVSLVGTADIVRAAIQRSVARASGLVQQLT